MNHWFPQLVALIDRQAKQPHVWGESDCLCRVADAGLIITGVDHAANYRGRYSSYEEALVLLRADGFSEPVDLVLSLTTELDHHTDATDGDIGALITDGGVLAFGIFIREFLYIATERGTGRLPRSRAERAFRVK